MTWHTGGIFVSDGEGTQMPQGTQRQATEPERNSTMKNYYITSNVNDRNATAITSDFHPVMT